MGVSKVELFYVIRYALNSPVPLPPLQPKIIRSLEKSIMMDELVSYNTHTGPQYKADNAQVYNLLDKALSGTNATTSITRHQRQIYVRSEYLDLVTHNIGS